MGRLTKGAKGAPQALKRGHISSDLKARARAFPKSARMAVFPQAVKACPNTNRALRYVGEQAQRKRAPSQGPALGIYQELITTVRAETPPLFAPGGTAEAMPFPHLSSSCESLGGRAGTPVAPPSFSAL
jgi:hypothetical protein